MGQDLGLIGLGVMGESLALNIESRGFALAVWNRWEDRTREFSATRAAGRRILPCLDLTEFVSSIERPRRILLMVQAGGPVDSVIDDILPLLAPGDILADCGNSLWTDTIRRGDRLRTLGIRFLGIGVSGGEEGALRGPSIMPGGDLEGWKALEPVLTAISAKVGARADVPCCQWVGPGGAGHFAKMVHNGIEYGDMQLIAESYALLSSVLGMKPEAMAEVFAQWNQSELESYLVEITANILATRDPLADGALIDVILDKAGQKGTGAWSIESALSLGVPVPTLAEAVFARSLSGFKEERSTASQILTGPGHTPPPDQASFVEAIRLALLSSKICTYAQGFHLLARASQANGWDLDLGRIALSWRGGCIVRARFLDDIHQALNDAPALPNLVLAPAFRSILDSAQSSWRWVVSQAALRGVAVPAFASALGYFDGLRTERSPANLLQAQRDYFGSHTFERKDRPGSFHHKWVARP